MAKKRQKKQGGQQFLSDENYIRQRAQTLKIGTCYVSDAITKAGEGTVIVSRLHTGGRKHRRVSRGCLLFRTEAADRLQVFRNGSRCTDSPPSA